jgi:hypothetical protein
MGKYPFRSVRGYIQVFYSAEDMKENLWWYLPEHRQKPRPRKGHAQKKSILTSESPITLKSLKSAPILASGKGHLMLFRQKIWPHKRYTIGRTRLPFHRDTQKPKPNNRPLHGTFGKSPADPSLQGT